MSEVKIKGKYLETQYIFFNKIFYGGIGLHNLYFIIGNEPNPES